VFFVRRPSTSACLQKAPAPIALVALLSAMLGCSQGPEIDDQIISGSLATTISNGTYMAATLGIELALLADERPALGSCPGVTEDGNEFLLEYGTGCAPTSGITPDLVSGHAQLTLASGLGAFVGDIEGLGFDNLATWGSVSGNVSTAGDLVTIDVAFEDLVWGENNEYALDMFFEIQGDATAYRIEASSGVFLPISVPEAFIDLDGVEAPRGALGPCTLPSAGTMRIERGYASAELTYTPENSAAGSVDISYNEGQVGTIAPCP